MRASRMEELIHKVSRTIDTTGGHGKKIKHNTSDTGAGTITFS